MLPTLWVRKRNGSGSIVVIQSNHNALPSINIRKICVSKH